MENELILIDIFAKLKEEINILKADIARLLQEKHDLEYNVCPALKALYMEKIGNLCYRIKAQQLMVEELKYRIQLVQAAINRDEVIKKSEMEKKVQDEYEEYHKKVEEQFQQAKEEKKQEETRKAREACQEEKYNQQQAKKEEQQQHKEEGQDQEPSEEPEDEFKGMSFKQKLKELYRRIVKKLHPDMNPDITEHEKELWMKTQEAFKEGDIEALEEIYNEINQLTVDEVMETEAGKDQLENLLESLKRQRERIIAEIDLIKNSFPYTEKELLEDDDAVAARQEELNDIIKEYEDDINELNERLSKLQEEANMQA